MRCGKTSIVAASELLIIRCTAERKNMFHTHYLIIDSDVEFVYEVCFNHEFGKFGSHQQPNLIEEALNEGCFENLIIKVVMLDDNAQEFSIIFLKTVILLLADLQFELSFYG